MTVWPNELLLYMLTVVFNYEELQNLIMNSINLGFLPPQIARLMQLKVLDVRSNKLGILPGWIGNCIKLETLLLDHNNISFLPKTIGQLR